MPLASLLLLARSAASPPLLHLSRTSAKAGLPSPPSHPTPPTPPLLALCAPNSPQPILRAPPDPPSCLPRPLAPQRARVLLSSIDAPGKGESAMLLALQSAGLSEEQSQHVWDKRPPGLLPSPTHQRALVEWLQGELSTRDPVRSSYYCLLREPRLMVRASRLDKLIHTRAALSRLCGNPSAERMASIISRQPKLLLASPAELKEQALWLCEQTSLPLREITSALEEAPDLLLCSREGVTSRLEWMRDELRIVRGGKLGRVVRNAPLSLSLSIQRTMRPRVEWLASLGLTKEDCGLIVLRSPKLLHLPRSQLQSKLAWLERNHVATGSQIVPLLRQQPDFFALHTKRNDATLALLRELGVGASEAAEMIRREPAILSQKLSELRLRASFFASVLGGTPADLVGSPYVLVCDLGRVVMLRHAFCMSHGIKVELSDMLAKSNAQFLEAVEREEAEVIRFEKEGKHLSFYQGASL